MAGVQEELSRELSRIIDCAYPVSLNKLSHILSRATVIEIETCIRDRPPSSISTLAELVLEALQSLPYTLRILHSLCHSVEFRNIVLQQEPSLLDKLLEKANGSQREFEEYAEICVLLLSRPLPDTIALPASAERFFLRAFEKAINAPNAGTLKPIYCMLDGACRELMRFLSPEARDAFDYELCRLLSSPSVLDDLMLLFWCFGIVVLAEHSEQVGGISKSILDFDAGSPGAVPERRWKTVSGRKLFGSTKEAYKTIDLIYLKVIQAVKGDGGVSDLEALQAIRIATRAMQFLDQPVRHNWPTLNSRSKNNFARLPSKIMQAKTDTTIQLEALCFYAMIAGDNNLPAEIVAQYETALLKLPSVGTDAQCLRQTISISLPLFAPRLRECTVHQVLNAVLDISFDSSSAPALSSASVLVDALTTVAPACTSLRSQMLLAMTSSELKGSVHGFLQSKAPHHTQDARQMAYHDTSYLCLRRTLHANIVSMLLATALTQSPECRLSPELTIALVSKQRDLADMSSRDHYTTPTTRVHSTVSLFEQECTPSTLSHQKDWRGLVNAQFEMQSKYQRDSVVRLVQQICQDLEHRCEHVEEPLRLEQNKVNELTKQVLDLQEEAVSLEVQATDRQHIMHGLEQEKIDISASLDDLKISFVNANKEADEALRAAQEDFSEKELQLQSLIATHEETLRSCDGDIHGLQNEVKQMEDKLQKEHKETEFLSVRLEALTSKLCATEHDLDSERQSAAQQAEEANQLGKARNSLEIRLTSTNEELADMTAKWHAAQSRHRELAESSEQALRDLEAKCGNDLEVAAAKATEEYNQLYAELQEALQNGQQAKHASEETQRNLQFARSNVEALNEKIQQLTEACTKKDNNLRSIEKTVLAAFPGTRSLPISIGPRVDSPDPQTPRQHCRHKSTARMQDTVPLKGTTGTQSITNTAMENVADASFTSSDSSPRSGPTPKRLKPRPHFKIPAMRTPHKEKSGRSSKSLLKKSSHSKRPALGEVSPNRRHTTVGFAIPENEEHDDKRALMDRRGSLCLTEQGSFDMGGYLDSTPFTPGNVVFGTGREPVGEDETTEL